MNRSTHDSPNWIHPIGSQVVTRVSVQRPHAGGSYPSGAVGIIAKAPTDHEHHYRVRFTDGFEVSLPHADLVLLADYKEGRIRNAIAQHDLFGRVILRCVIGSRAYGLDNENSDIDRRGAFLPLATQHWSLFGVPEQIELDATQECYWELQKFVVLALKANPNVLECLYSPLVETATPLGQELIGLRDVFLSRLAYQTYNGYVMSQFKKMHADIRNQGQVKWKHVMHLIRLLLAGIRVLREGTVPVQVVEHRDALLAIRNGDMPWDQVERWRQQLHHELDLAFARTSLPEQPNYEAANAFLVKARHRALEQELP